MVIKILKNNTAGIVPINDVGVAVPASGQLTIDPNDYPDFAASNDTIGFLADGTLTANDGTIDLNLAEGTALLLGSFIRKEIDFRDPLKTNDLGIDERLKIDVEGNLNLGDGTLKVSANDSTAGFLEDKVSSSTDDVSIVTINEGLNEQIQVTFNPANVGTSELNNDANFIDAAGAPVQSVAGKTGVVLLNNNDVGLGNVPNIDATDADNVTVDPIPDVVPVGGSTQTALENLQANIDDVLDGTTPINHGDLTGLQGGQASEYFHLTSSEHNILRSGSQDATSLHNHDSRY
jgi:hypothetical protein